MDNPRSPSPNGPSSIKESSSSPSSSHPCQGSSLDVGEPVKEPAFYEVMTCPEQREDEEQSKGNAVDGASNNDENDSPTRGEKSLMLKLYGRNECEFVEVDGWTRAIPISFPGIRQDLRLKVGQIPDGMSPDSYLEEAQTFAESLEDLSRCQQSFYKPVKCVLVFQLIAKKAARVVLRKPIINGKVVEDSSAPSPANVIGNAIVADDSGACMLTCFNESTQLFLQHVQIGDYIVCHKSHSRGVNMDTFRYKQPFHSKLLDLEIKVDKYDIRGINVIPFHTIKSPQLRKLRPNLFDSALFMTFLPSDICQSAGVLELPEEPASPTTSSQASQSCPPDDQSKPYFNLIGVISSVSRIGRTLTTKEAIPVLCMEDSLVVEDGDTTSQVTELRSIHQYYMCCCLEIIDMTSSPILVKIFFNQTSKATHEKLIPGSLIILTHCRLSKGLGIDDSVKTSVFTEIYLNENYEKYFQVLPVKEIKRLESFLKLQTFKEIYKRADVCWSVGGFYPIRIKDPEGFREFVNSYKEEYKGIERRKVFERREFISTLVKAKVIAAYLLKDENCRTHVQKPTILHPEVFKNNHIDTNGYHVISDSSNCLCSKCASIHWQAKKWRLPQPTIPTSKQLSVFQLLRSYIEQNAEVSSLFHLEKNDQISNEALMEIAGKPMFDEEPAYLVCLIDVADQVKYYALWKGLPADVMREKLIDVKKGKDEVWALLEVFCYESQDKHGLEVNLKDFLAITDE